MKIIYKKGDAVHPDELLNNKVVIAHGCNNIGAWGAGFVIPLGIAYPKAKQQYLNWKPELRLLGSVQIVNIGINLKIANMITQQGCGKLEWLIPFRYYSFAECLIRLKNNMEQDNFMYLVMPRIGCGLAGAKWNQVEKIINKVFQNSKIQVIIYDRSEDYWPGTKYVSQ